MKPELWLVSRPRACTIVSLSLPIVLILLAQTLLGLATIAMVSHLGDAAVAGVGIANALFSMLMAVLFGVDTGVQALVAHRVGAGQIGLAGRTLNDALLIAVVAGVLLMALGYGLGASVFRMVTDDPAVTARGLSYLITALPMLPLLGCIFAFSAYRNGAGTPRYSLLVTLIQVACAIVFSDLLIFGAAGLPPMGTAGAGLGTTLATLLALLAHLLLALRSAPIPSFLQAWPRWRGIRSILAIGLPVGLQQSFVYLGTTVAFSIVGLIGTAEIAAMNVLLAMLLLSILPTSGMGVAAATLVGMALGRSNVADARQWGWDVARCGALVILILSLFLMTAPRDMLGLVIADPMTIALAAAPLRVLTLGMSVDAFGRILGFALRGAGATKLVTLVAFALQWGVQLPLSWFVGVYLEFSLLGITIVRLVLFAVEAAIVTLLWRHGFWTRRRVTPPLSR